MKICFYFVFRNDKIKLKKIKTSTLIFTSLFLLFSAGANAQWRQLYDEVAFYVAAHQDDWQLFMGSNVFDDINSFNEKNPNQNGKKVVIIYTTAGNLHDDDDRKSCMCSDPFDPHPGHIPYWRVREVGAKNSVHLAACRIGGWGSVIPYPKNKTVIINGHSITKYEFKNTVSYFLRTKTGNYERWIDTPSAVVQTVDSSTVYADWADLVNTIYYIYKAEMDSSLTTSHANFNFPDLDATLNPGDHPDHFLAGKAAYEAAKILGKDMKTCFEESLFVDYHTKDLPQNISSPDIQNEAALTAVYCMALLDYNAWPEWSSIYQEWTTRNYYRTITSCENALPQDLLVQDSLVQLSMKAYPSPADETLFIRFNLPTKAAISVKITDINGAIVFEDTFHLSADNTVAVNTRLYGSGTYTLLVKADGEVLGNFLFNVLH